MAFVLVLNGTSSSGKTTLARELQNRAPRRLLNFSIDNLLQTLPPRSIERLRQDVELDDIPVRALVEAFYRCAGLLLDLGHDLILDHAVTARYHAELLISAVRDHEVILVGLDCPVDVLDQRERQRGDRRPGLASQQSGTIHKWLDYDLLIDSSQLSPTHAADELLAALAGGGGDGILRTRERLHGT